MRTYSIIVPVYNGKRTIENCIKRILSLSGVLEIIVVDNGSTDGTRECLENLPITYMLAPKKGASHARNVGAIAAKGTVLLFIDSDVYVPLNLIEKIDLAFENAGKDIAAIQTFYSNSFFSMNRISLYKQTTQYLMMHRRSFQEITQIGTSCVAIRREAFFEAQAFDEDIPGATIEDVDFSNRLLSLGYKVKADQNIQVDHDCFCTLISYWNEKYHRSQLFTVSSLKKKKVSQQKQIPFVGVLSNILKNKSYFSPSYVLSPMLLLMVMTLLVAEQWLGAFLLSVLFLWLNIYPLYSGKFKFKTKIDIFSFIFFRTTEVIALGLGILSGLIDYVKGAWVHVREI